MDTVTSIKNDKVLVLSLSNNVRTNSVSKITSVDLKSRQIGDKDAEYLAAALMDNIVAFRLSFTSLHATIHYIV